MAVLDQGMNLAGDEVDAGQGKCHLYSCSRAKVAWIPDRSRTPPIKARIQARMALHLGQHYLTPFDLIAAKTSDRFAMRADDGRLTCCNPQVGTVTWMDRFFKCDEPRALR